MTRNDITSKFKGDFVIWIVIVGLCVYSAVAVYSGIARRAILDNSFSTEYLYLLRHVFIIIAGLILMWLIHLVKWHNALQKSASALLLISWGLLICTMIFGKEINGATRWLDLYVCRIQTSDIAKLALIIYLSSVFANIKTHKNDFKWMLKWVYAPIVITCVLIVKDNNSTAAILFVVSVILMFLARIPMKQIFTLIGICILGIAIVFIVFDSTRFQTAVNRISGYNVKEKKIDTQEFRATLAIAEGGLYGKGPGKSEQRYQLRNVESDYIFAIIVEEYGLLLGAIPIITFFLILTFRGIKISLNSSRKFSAYLVLGITFMYILQAFINIGVAVDLLPVTGQPMPFVSRGGTMFIMCCIAFGLVLSESRINDEEKLAIEPAEVREEETE